MSFVFKLVYPMSTKLKLYY